MKDSMLYLQRQKRPVRNCLFPSSAGLGLKMPLKLAIGAIFRPTTRFFRISVIEKSGMVGSGFKLLMNRSREIVKDSIAIFSVLFIGILSACLTIAIVFESFSNRSVSIMIIFLSPQNYQSGDIYFLRLTQRLKERSKL